jgi:GH25 family lysozyme M1 (1,4-beta-N-acetylmuramidase)
MGAAIPSNRSVTQKLTPNSMYPDSDFIDVSSNNNYISVADYKAMKRAGIGGVVVKLTEYETYKNPLASSQISNAISAGLKVSAYHYSWFGDIASAKSEANYFAAYAKYLGLPANTLMVNDFESETCLKSSDGTNLSKVFSNQLKANGYGRVLHYSSGSVFENGKLNQSALLPDLIWTAGYPSNPSSSNLRYTSSAAWQWNDNMSFPGVNGAYDISMDYKNLFVNPTTTVVEPADTLDNFTGDWNGDGKDSIMLNLKNSYYVKDSFNTNGADYKFIYGNTGDYAIVGDWDGNGTDTLSIRRENIYFISNSNTSGIAQREIKYGNSNDEIFVGDWDGDGKDTLAIRRENVFYFKDSMQSGIADRVITYGNSGDKVLIGDWDGDGKDTLAVHRGDKFYIKNGITTGKADITFTYGNPNGDSAVAGDWDGDSIDTFAIKRGDTYYLNNKFYGGRAEQTVLLDPNIICK